MKIALSIEGKDIGEFDYRTIGRSETWKENVCGVRLSLRSTIISPIREGNHLSKGVDTIYHSRPDHDWTRASEFLRISGAIVFCLLI